jgi:rhodanese-related sulfurtransferase
MVRILTIAALAAWFTAGFACQGRAADKTPDQMVREARSVIRELSVVEVKRMLDAGEKVVILDVRDEQEFDTGRLPGALNLSRGNLEFKAALTLPNRNDRIVVYCGLDLRGPLATRTLNELGYKGAVNMAGGLKAWKEAGYPVEK